MPYYEFACTECGTRFEKHMPMNGTHVEIACPKGHHAVQRVYSPPQVVFKGKGWYSTDHHTRNSIATSE